MKYRNGFVSNSSSSSFIVKMKTVTVDGKLFDFEDIGWKKFSTVDELNEMVQDTCWNSTGDLQESIEEYGTRDYATMKETIENGSPLYEVRIDYNDEFTYNFVKAFGEVIRDDC